MPREVRDNKLLINSCAVLGRRGEDEDQGLWVSHDETSWRLTRHETQNEMTQTRESESHKSRLDASRDQVIECSTSANEGKADSMHSERRKRRTWCHSIRSFLVLASRLEYVFFFFFFCKTSCFTSRHTVPHQHKLLPWLCFSWSLLPLLLLLAASYSRAMQRAVMCMIWLSCFATSRVSCVKAACIVSSASLHRFPASRLTSQL